MLRNTFCHLPRITPQTEGKLWRSGIRSWEDLAAASPDAPPETPGMKASLEESLRELNGNNPLYFTGLLPSNQHWRLFPEFRNSIAYLDIETTGLGGPGDHITTIALYDGRDVFHYVHGENLRQFVADIKRYRLLVTYNGKCFDLPFIERSFGITLKTAHIDLRYVLHALGYKGGLKKCEERLGMARDGLEGIDGYFAVMLWQDYKRTGSIRSLETLLAYNIQDVVNLETIMVKAYNLRIAATPFAHTHQLPMPLPPELPFRPDPETIARVRARAWQRAHTAW